MAFAQVKVVSLYDATYQFGKTVVHVVAPIISEQERQFRLREVKRINAEILKNLMYQKLAEGRRE